MVENSKKDFFYFSGYVLYISAVSFWGNFFSSISQSLKIVGIICILITFCMQKVTVKRFTVYILIGLLMVYFCYSFNNYSFALAYVFIISFSHKNIERFERLVEVDFYVRLTGFICTNLFYFIGAAKDVQLLRVSSDHTIVRHSFGYVHPNICFMTLFVIIVDYYLLLVIKNKRINLYHVIFSLAVTVLYRIGTDSRSGFYLIILLIAVFVLQSRRKFLQKHSKIVDILCFSPLICLALSILFIYIYGVNDTLAKFMKELTTNRISSMYYFWNKYDITLFGQKLYKIGTQEAERLGVQAYVLDNLYINLILNQGIVFTALFIYYYIRTCFDLKKSSNYYYLVVLAIFVIYGMFEGITVNIDFNYFLILLSIVIKDQVTRKDNIVPSFHKNTT